MNKFEQILRKNIQAVTLDTVQTQTSRVDEYPPSKFPCNVPNTPFLDVNVICAAVNRLSSNVGNPGDNKCAQTIKKYNVNECSKKKYVAGQTVIGKCNDYAYYASADRATDAQKAEAKRKARCDCLNFALYGSPVLTSSSVSAKIMKSQIEDFYNADCSYTWLSRVCAERQKVIDELNSISPACAYPL